MAHYIELTNGSLFPGIQHIESKSDFILIHLERQKLSQVPEHPLSFSFFFLVGNGMVKMRIFIAEKETATVQIALCGPGLAEELGILSRT